MDNNELLKLTHKIEEINYDLFRANKFIKEAINSCDNENKDETFFIQFYETSKAKEKYKILELFIAVVENVKYDAELMKKIVAYEIDLLKRKIEQSNEQSK